MLDHRAEPRHSLINVIGVKNREDGLSLQLVGRIPRSAGSGRNIIVSTLQRDLSDEIEHVGHDATEACLTGARAASIRLDSVISRTMPMMPMI